ncbi:MAG TPA: hypothetical protein VN203_28340, partial [Candidatus Acidoferrum sp.]|nr:hypothetical protein [Candidatus Acidoferrum sp.]
MSDLPAGLMAWYLALCLVSLLNIGLLLLSWRKHLKSQHEEREEAAQLRRQLLVLSTIFVLGCAFRGFLPRADVQRIVLVDT